MVKKETEEKKTVKSTKKAGTVVSNDTSTTKKTSSTKKVATKKSTTKNTKSNVTNTTKKSSSTKKTTSKKSTSNASATKKASTTKKAVSKKTTTKRASKEALVSIIEYYDLPYRYNQTIVKILAQTPNMLFVYWDISDDDRLAYITHYGDNFFSETKPVLVIHNVTMNYSFEIEINDFANSWYLHVNDANCKYEIELGRRPLQYISNIKEDYIYISSSNKLDAPNDHILFENFKPKVSYRNIRTGNIVKKDFSKLSIKNFYKEIYHDDLFDELSQVNLRNPSSNSSF